MIQETIRIGTLVKGEADIGDYLRQILPHGFESFSVMFWQTLGDSDLPRLAEDCHAALADSDAVISSLSIYGNPLMDNAEAHETRRGWERLIDAAESFGCDLVTGFTGRIVDEPIEASLSRFAEVFGPLAERAADRGVRIAFENCQMDGNWQRGGWNIAHGPPAWELMFNTLTNENLGLEWEPCHQLVGLVELLPQLRTWTPKIFHVHGKDASVRWDVIRESGIFGPEAPVFHRTPGFGDSDWTAIISELRRNGFAGCIDIEGWHDPVYRDDLELTGQVHALNYLKGCRGGRDVRCKPTPS